MKLNTTINPSREEWKELCKRPLIDFDKLEAICAEIFNDIEANGDAALSKYTKQFDGVVLKDFLVSKDEIEASKYAISPSLKEAILRAKDNIVTFHSEQKHYLVEVRPMEGVVCRQEARPIEKVGIYIPGGTAPLFSSVLMLAGPAQIAGCKEIIMCTPPDKEGNINPAILYAASICGVTKIYKLGGVQAIASMALGTETVPLVYKILGPGNQYVMAAKQMAQRKGIAIDMPAGPSEVLVIADDTAIPQFVAADLLSQAEHGVDSQTILLATSEDIVKAVEEEIEKLLQQISRKDIAIKALGNSKTIVFESVTECINFSNFYAPEHLILSVKNYNQWTYKINNAGSVFLGNYSPESAGDYASGTNHTLPTNGYAKAYSGVNLDTFLKKITFQEITSEGIKNLGRIVEIMADTEQLEAHTLASKVRRDSLNQ